MSEAVAAGRSVRANAAAVAVAQLASKAAAFVALVVIARAVSIEDFGRYTLATALVALLSPLADLGTDLHVTRLAARAPGDRAGLLGASLSLKLATSLLLVAVAGAVALVLRYAAPVPLLVVLAGVTAAATSVSGSWFAVLRAARRMDREAAGTVVSRLLFLAATLAALALGGGIVPVTGAQAAAALLALVPVMAFARGAAPAALLAGARARWGELVRGGAPFLFTAVVVTVYFRLDTVMLSLMRGERSTGIYGACANLLFASLLLSQALVTAIFPVVAEAGTLADARARTVMRRALALSLAASLPLALGAAAFAGPGLELFYGAGFREGAPALVLLACTAPVLFTTNLFGHALAATGLQRDVLVISSVNALVNIGLNLVLIPRFDAAGAALATLVTELAGLAMFAVRLRRELGWVLSWPALARVLAANAAFAVLLVGLRGLAWPMPVVLASAIAGYAGLVLAAGVVRADDVRALVSRGAEGGQA